MKIKNLLMLMAGASTIAASAQTDDVAGLIITRTTPEDSVILAKGRLNAPDEIPVPKFVVKSKDRNFYMTIGGKISPIMGVDLGNSLYNQDGAGISFVTQKIPVPAQAGHKGDYFINALGNTAIDFQVVGLAGTPDQITGYLKFSTNGMSHSANISRAYVSWRNFTGGLKPTLFKDGQACQPSTIDPQGPSGTVSTSVYEVNYTSEDYNGFKFAVGLDMPTWYSSNGIYRGKDYPEFDNKQVANYADAEQMVPDIPAWIQYGTSDNNRVRISGLLRNFSYRDLVSNTTRHMVGWGAMLSGNLNPVKPLILYYQAAYGKGIGAYLQDISGLPLSFIPENAHPGKMTASEMMGVNLGLTYNINDKWQVNLVGSESRIGGVRDYAIQSNDTNYRYALYAAGNVFYNITPYLQWGIEYVWGHRETWNNGGASDSRIQTQISFKL